MSRRGARPPLTRTLRLLVAALAGGCLVVAAPAGAQAALHAKIDNGAQLKRVKAGQFKVLWTLDGPAEQALPGGKAKDAANVGVYLQVGAAGGDSGSPSGYYAGRPTARGVRGAPAGQYESRFQMPSGGITSIAIKVDESGDRVDPVDVPIENNPFAAAAGSDDDGGGPPWVIIIIALAVVALFAVIFVLGRQRPDDAAPTATG